MPFPFSHERPSMRNPGFPLTFEGRGKLPVHPVTWCYCHTDTPGTVIKVFLRCFLRAVVLPHVSGSQGHSRCTFHRVHKREFTV